MICDISNVEPLDHLRLKVAFSDGMEGEVRFEESHLSGVFAALKDRDYFSRVNCANGFVEWPDDLDLASDAMYDAIKEFGVWVLS